MSEAHGKDILIVEPFNGGSHGQLIQLLMSDSEIGPRCDLVSLPAKKWHWRARTSALYFSQIIPVSKYSNYRVIFTSSVLNLAELIALRPDLSHLKKIVYFHENQLVYPVRELKDRDFQYGYNQILTSLVADVAVFNSSFNMESFLSSISSHLKLIPDHRPKNLQDIIRPKCRVLSFPVYINQGLCESDQPDHSTNTANNSNSLHDGDRSSQQQKVPGLVDTDSQTLIDIQCNNTVETLVHKCCTISENRFQLCDTGSMDLCLRPACLGSDIVNYRHCDNEGNVTDVQGTSEGNVTDVQGTSEGNVTDVQGTSEGNVTDVQGTSEGNVTDVQVTSEGNVTVVQGTSTHSVYKNGLSEPLNEKGTCLHIVWPHRWEHDKDPDSFFKAVLQLKSEGCHFKVSVVGEMFTDVPDIFHLAKSQLSDRIGTWGYQTRQNYLNILDSAHVVVSTALHEFFGVSMLEATAHGCYPLCPKRLVYPEIYPEECMYSTQAQLVKRLRRFCQRPDLVKTDQFRGLAERFSWGRLRDEYRQLLLG